MLTKRTRSCFDCFSYGIVDVILMQARLAVPQQCIMSSIMTFSFGINAEKVHVLANIDFIKRFILVALYEGYRKYSVQTSSLHSK